jgi:hypothetical protein
MTQDKSIDWGHLVVVFCVIVAYFSLLVFVASYFYLLYATCFLGYQSAIHHYVEFIESIVGR